jgi:hypothetical protein
VRLRCLALLLSGLRPLAQLATIILAKAIPHECVSGSPKSRRTARAVEASIGWRAGARASFEIFTV